MILRVLYCCMFSSLLYSCEAWGDITCIAERLLLIERKALKRCLGVKSGTSDDIIYFELNQPDIVSVIQQRQLKFFNKLLSVDPKEAIVKSIMVHYANMSTPSKMIKY